MLWPVLRPLLVSTVVVMAAVIALVVLRLAVLVPVAGISWLVYTQIYVCREMASRRRPIWLRVVVVLLLPICYVGWAIWMYDLGRQFDHGGAVSART